MANNFEIIDATLRDGSNAINFQFSIDDTVNIVKGLEHSGIKWIEVGHGLGLGASERTSKKALQTDEEYITAAKKSVNQAKVGCFFLQDIGTKEDINKAASWGLDFLRIGPNADMEEIKESGEYISYAKSKGLIVHCCIRKAYAVTPDEIARQAKVLETFGTDAVIIMDSAGHLLPNQSKEYVYALKDKMRGNIAMKVGYHAHDNLSLSVACSLAAVEAGADTIDTCLKGLGRSAGNAPTEVIAAVLMRMGNIVGDFYGLQDVAEKYIGKKVVENLESISLSFGLAGFHSAFYGMVDKVATEFNIDPRILVVEVCKVERIKPTEEMIYKIAKELIPS